MFKIFLSIILTISPILGFAQTAGKFIEANNSTGLAIGPNYVKNPNAETGLNDVTPSGATLSRVCSSPEILDNGTCSFDIQSGTAGNLVRWLSQTLPASVKGTNCMASFKYQYDNLGNAADSWYAVVEDGSANEISPRVALVATMNTVAAPNDGTSRVGIIEGYPCAANQQNVLAIKHTTSNSSRVIIDTVWVTDALIPSAPAAVRTNPASYTPTLTNLGTGATSNLQWFVDGSNISITGTITCGTTPAASPSVSLPAGYTTASGLPATSQRGTFFRGSSTANHGGTILIAPSATVFTLSSSETFSNTASSSLTTSAGGVCANAETISINAIIPIQGANNSITVPASCINNPDCQNNFTAEISAAGVVSKESSDFINGNCSISDTSLFACSFVASRFSAAPVCVVSSASSSALSYAQTDGSASTTIVNVRTVTAPSTKVAHPSSITCSRAGTDVKPWGPIPWLSGMVSSNSTSSIRNEFAMISGASMGAHCTSSPCTIFNPSTPGWISSVTRTTTGQYVINFASDVWSGNNYVCLMSTTQWAGTPSTNCITNARTQTSMTINCINNAGSNDAGIAIDCKGPR